MCKVAIRLPPRPVTKLQGDNLRSERRWERQVLEALLQCDWTTSVHTLTPVWQGDYLSEKFIDGLPLDQYNQAIVFYNDYPRIEGFPGKFKGLVINSIGEGDEPVWNILREARKKEYGQNFFYALGYYWPSNLMKMKEYIGDVEFLPIPDIPRMLTLDNGFDRNIILWNRRGIVNYLTSDSQQSFKWIASKLATNPLLEFHIITGEKDESIVNKQLLFSTSGNCLSKFENRIFMHANLSWTDVQLLYQKTKLVISPPGFCFENGDIEAAAAGIPTVFHTNYEMDKKDFIIEEWDSKRYYGALDLLFYYKEFYIEKSKIYKNFVERYHTYQVFTDNLYNILLKRSLIEKS